MPAAHGPPVAPHTHAPPAEQVSEVAGHAAHIAPVAPHWAPLVVVHTFPAQHPVVQLVASQTQALPLHRCPGPQAGLVPHTHEPVASQAVALFGSQAEQAEPLKPQLASVCPRHVSAAEQQPTQLLKLQPPPVHCPLVHV